MADNLTLTDREGEGFIAAMDDVGGVYYQRIKIGLGGDGVASDALGGAGPTAPGVQRVVLADDDLAVSHLEAIKASVEGETYALLTNASATGSTVANVRSGSYLWSVVGTWSGATATLQFLGPNGVTWLPAKSADGVTTAALTANGTIGVVIGADASVRVSISGGPPSALYSNLS